MASFHLKGCCARLVTAEYLRYLHQIVRNYGKLCVEATMMSWGGGTRQASRRVLEAVLGWKGTAMGGQQERRGKLVWFLLSVQGDGEVSQPVSHSPTNLGLPLLPLLVRSFLLSVYHMDGMVVFVLLMICTCAYIKRVPRLKGFFLSEKQGFFGVLYKGTVSSGQGAIDRYMDR